MAKSAGSEASDPNTKMIARNRKAFHEYEIFDRLECGIALQGSEVKSLRLGKASLDEAYARVINNEVWLLACDIPEYPQASWLNHSPRRERRLLLHRREVLKFAAAAEQQGCTLIPLALYFSNGRVKVELAVGKGKKLHDKREKLKKDAAQREMRNAMSPKARRSKP